MVRLFKITFLLVLAITMCTTANAAKNKNLKNGFFYYEGKIDKKTMLPMGEGTLYFRKSVGDFAPTTNFDNLFIMSGTFNGWKSHGVIKHPMWTFTGDIEVTPNTLVLTNGDIEIKVLENFEIDEMKFDHSDDVIRTIWGEFPQVFYMDRGKKEKFKITSPITFTTQIKKMNDGSQYDSKNTYLNDPDILPQNTSYTPINVKGIIQNLGHNSIDSKILDHVLVDYNNGTSRIGLTSRRLKGKLIYTIGSIDKMKYSYAGGTLTLQKLDEDRSLSVNYIGSDYTIVNKYGSRNGQDIIQMYCSKDKCWYVSKIYQDSTQISKAIVTPDNQIVFGNTALELEDDTETSWYIRNGKRYQDEKPRQNIYKLRDSRAIDQQTTADMLLKAQTLPSFNVVKRKVKTLVKDKDTQNLLGSITLDGKYHNRTTVNSQTANRQTARNQTARNQTSRRQTVKKGSNSSDVETAKMIINLYRGVKDSRKRYKEEQRRKEIRKILRHYGY